MTLALQALTDGFARLCLCTLSHHYPGRTDLGLDSSGRHASLLAFDAAGAGPARRADVAARSWYWYSHVGLLMP